MKIKLVVCCLLSFVCMHSVAAKQPRVLVFSKTTTFYHESIPEGVAAIQALGKQHGFIVDTTKDAAAFTDKNLKKYAAVIFLNTADATTTLLNDGQQQALMRFIQAGKGFVGIHAAADALYKWEWYNKLVGAYFKNHPAPQEAELLVTDSNFIATKGLPAAFKHFDEWYNYKSTHWNDVQVVLTVNEKTYKGGGNGDPHPIAWYHNYDGGRSFYLGLGHTKECYADPVFLKILLGGVRYAMGK